MRIAKANYAQGKGAGKVVFTLLDGTTRWISATTFANLAGPGLNPQSFVGGNFEGQYLPIGATLLDGSTVTDENVILDQLSVSLSLESSVVANMAVIGARIQAEQAMEAAFKARAARIAAQDVNAD